MKKLSLLLAAAVTVSTMAQASGPSVDPLKETPAQKTARMKWFEMARFGMFIHWGLYSVAAGSWQGQDDGGAGEWILNNRKIDPVEYEKFRDEFNPVKFDADKWVRIAKNAGMKYIVITTKHHEGFDMWPTTIGDWNIGHTQFHRDPLKELAVACKKAGIKLCFYHSIMDWHNIDYLPHRAWDKRPTDPSSFPKYVAYMKSQLKELLTNYGPIGLIWFDGQWEGTWNHDEGKDLYAYVRSLQPNVIVNDRVDSSNVGPSGVQDGIHYGDYGTPEQRIPANGLSVPWETCMTMNGTWGFRTADHNWKSPETLIHNLVDIASKGGNYLLNVGPTALGEIPDASIERLAVVGKWTKTNGEALYGTTASPFPRSLPWGRVTQKPGKLFLSVFDGSKGSIELTGLKSKITDAYLLASPQTKLVVTEGAEGPTIKLPATLSDPIATVIVAKVDGKPVVEMPPIPVVVEKANPDGTVKLVSEDVQVHGDTAKYEDVHKAIGFWTDSADYLTWKVLPKTAGTYKVTLEYACADDAAGGTFKISDGTNLLEGSIAATGSWGTFVKTEVGTITLPEGQSEFKITPTHLAGNGLMNLRSITLTPIQ
jgi:alpha-L-fucosidase